MTTQDGSGGVRLPPIGELGLRRLPQLEHKLELLVEKEARENLRNADLQKGYPGDSQNDELQNSHDLERRRDLIDSGLESHSEHKEKNEQTRRVATKRKDAKSSARRDIKKKVKKRNKSSFSDDEAGHVKGLSLPQGNGKSLAVWVPGEGPGQIEPANLGEKSRKEAFATSCLNTSNLTEETLVSESDHSRNDNKDSHIEMFAENSENTARNDYRALAIRLANSYCRPKTGIKKRQHFVDYLLIFDGDDDNEFNEKQRDDFEKLLVNEGMEVTRTHIGKEVFVELSCSFKRLCQEAEYIFLEMPLIGLSLHHDNSTKKSRWKRFESEKEVDDICIPFCNATRDIYDGFNDKENFFRPGIRSLLVHQILKDIKIDDTDSNEHHNVEALASLLHSDVYTDAFILHERSSLDPRFPLSPYKNDGSGLYPLEPNGKLETDRRKDLHETWLANFKFQPLWKIRNYFGEKIALYFAWLGVLITSLWIPTFLGLVIFIYGIILSIVKNEASTWSRVAFDNDLTPGFALIICLWGTVFLEVWKRKNAELAYKWDVDSFEQQEPNRPQFYGTELQLNPITGLYEPFYPPLKKTLKSMGSMALIFFMVLLVIGSLISVIVYRIISRVDWFVGQNSIFLSNVTSSVLNSTSIMLLGYFYKALGKKLTEWENHRTQTQFEDSLILKLFGFQFVNSYSSLYYIAFFRERTKDGILGKGDKYTDSCGTANDCMSLLSLQVGILMLMKPMPKFCTDVVAPLFFRSLKSLARKMKRNKVLDEGSFVNENVPADVEFEDYMRNEKEKPPIKDFTLSEYTEKVIQYGYLMLFAAACPLAPLIALVTNLVDLRIDARRLLWLNRRPVPFRAQDIGMWYTILQLLNYIGVVTNGFIIAITSSFGRKYKTTTVFNVLVANNTSTNGTSSLTTTTQTVVTLEYLWIIILFQNISFIVKFILEYSISDVPEKVTLARKKEKYAIEEVLKKAGYRCGRGKTIVPAVEKSSNPTPSEGEQMLIENKKAKRRETIKEKIRKLSNKSSKGKTSDHSKKLGKSKSREFYLKDDGGKGGDLTV
ncbi:anoctamin-7-like [Rhopilema esculentum]|uniref:anoctamin-7-like n=1 Tax=Rhopilema esculentum TaxID=499914 RepID=UPI0031D2DFB3